MHIPYILQSVTRGTYNIYCKENSHTPVAQEMSRHRAYPGIVDVARAAGVSPSTVSRAFSRPGHVSEATAQQIFDTANRLGYRSGTITPLTAGKPKHRLILLAVSDISNPAFAQLIRNTQHECMRQNSGLLIADTEETKMNERDSLHDLNNVDGVLLASSRLSDTMIRKFARHHKVVMINRMVRGLPSVIPDYRPGFESAVARLIALGHTGVTYLTGPEASYAEGMRWRTLSDVCKEKNMSLKRLPCKEPTFEAGRKAFSQFMQQPDSTSVIAYNDLQAMGFIAAAQQQQIDVPQRFSIIGIDDIADCTLLSPTLSSIRIDRRKESKAAVAMLFDNDNADAHTSLKVPTQFIERNSVSIPGSDH